MKISIKLFLLFVTFIFKLSAQTAFDPPLGYYGPKPRMKRHSDSPGVYLLVSRFKEIVINPGDSIVLDIYITGYGNIQDAKLLINISGDIYVDSLSTITNSIGIKDIPDSSRNMIFHKIFWGNKIDTMYTNGKIYFFDGVHSPQWKEPTLFIDQNWRDTSNNIVYTEIYTEHAPFVCNFRTQKGLSGGDYGINLYFTYFNGKEWKADRQIVSFKVRNVLERNQWWAWPLALIISILTLIPRTTEIINLVKSTNRWKNRKLRLILRKSNIVINK